MGCSASEIKGQPKPKVEPEPKGHAIEKTIDNEPIKPKPAIKPKYPKNTLDKYSSSGEDEDSVIEKEIIPKPKKPGPKKPKVPKPAPSRPKKPKGRKQVVPPPLPPPPPPPVPNHPEEPKKRKKKVIVEEINQDFPKSELSDAEIDELARKETTKKYITTYDQQFAHLDELAANLPKDKYPTCESLVSYFMSQERNELRLLRLIWRWITGHVVYDIGYLKGKEVVKNPNEIMLSKLAIGEGFSALFHRLCSIAHIEAEIVNGYHKGDRYRQGEALKNHKDITIEHVWNAVKEGGKWQFVDCCWGSGILNKNSQFTAQYNEKYWLIQPEAMIYTYFPTIPKLQFLKENIEYKDFVERVKINPIFFDLGLRFISHKKGLITTQNGKVMIVLLSTKGERININVNLRDANRKLLSGMTDVKYLNNLIYISVFLPETATYQLDLFGHEEEDEVNSTSDTMPRTPVQTEALLPSDKNIPLLAYSIQSNVELNPRFRFPKTYAIMPKFRLSLARPMLGSLMTDRKGEATVELKCEDKLTYVKAKLFDENGELEDYTMVQMNRNLTQVKVHSPIGEFTLSLFAMRNGVSIVYTPFMDFNINSSTTSTKFPHFTPEYYNLNMNLIEPLEGIIYASDGTARVLIGKHRSELKYQTRLYEIKEEDKDLEIKDYTLINTLEDDNTEILVHTPKPTNYKLMVFTKLASQEGTNFLGILSFKIQSVSYAESFPTLEPEIMKELDIKCISEQGGIIRTTDGKAEVILSVGQDTELQVKLFDESDKILTNYTHILKDNNLRIVQARTPKPGIYKLTISARQSWKSTQCFVFLTLSINSDSSSNYFPQYYPKYEELGVELVSPETGEIKSTTGRIVILLREEVIMERPLEIKGKLEDEEEDDNENYVMSKLNKDNLWEVAVHTPKAKEYNLHIFARRGESKYARILTYNIQSKADAPKFVNIYDIGEGTLIGPVDGILIKGREYEFSVYSETALHVSIPDREGWKKFTLDKETNIWSVNYKIPSNTHIIHINLSYVSNPEQEDKWFTLAQYKTEG